MQANQVLAQLEASMSPEALREFGRTVLRLADSIDQNWPSNAAPAAYSFFSQAARIRRNSISLSLVAIREERRAAIRDELLGFDLVGVPAWIVLLELFKQSAGDAKVSTKTLQIISGLPETSALRLIRRLEEQGLVERSPSSEDKGVTFITLTKSGLVKIGTILERLNV